MKGPWVRGRKKDRAWVGGKKRDRGRERGGYSPLRFGDQTGALNCPRHNGVFRIIAFSVLRPIQRDSGPFFAIVCLRLVMEASSFPRQPPLCALHPTRRRVEPLGRGPTEATGDLYAAI
ncbi:hypothetical protein KM043_008123 [Ampulex compressa]|nr:hypothetical protein KM043_008123 [Ampulex compressa]